MKGMLLILVGVKWKCLLNRCFISAYTGLGSKCFHDKTDKENNTLICTVTETLM